MASKRNSNKPATLPLDEEATGSIFAEAPFEHGGVAYSDGLHNDLPAGLRREIVEAGKAEACERPADRSAEEAKGGQGASA